MMLAALFISGMEWALPAAALVGVAAVALVWNYFKSPAHRAVRLAGFFLKALGLAALGFCLLEPLWSTQRARPGANFFAVVADNSQGMQIKDRGETRSRGEALRELLASDKETWPAKLNEGFQVRRYAFDSRLQAAKDFAELQFDGRASAIGSALRTVADRFQGQPLAGVLLFTDGNATDLTDSINDINGLPPVYPVVIGRDDPIKDVSVQKIAVTQTAFEDAPVTLDATVIANGYGGTPILAQLFELADASARPSNVARPVPSALSNNVAAAKASVRAAPRFSEKVAAELTQNAPQEGGVMTFRFQVRPSKPGVSFYRLQVAAKGEAEQFSDPKLSSEATLANNSRMVVVDRGRGPYRILYVAGRPNWEYKFLNRALTEDDQVQLVGLIRVAKREPKFEFKGREGESSNPLFRGFGKQGEDTERYDQPVLIRLNTLDEAELRGGFPKTAEDLYGYHAVIVDDLEAEFFTHEQMTLLQKFASERGGGFLMLGGMESFAQGKYERTPVGDLLPVYLDRVAATGKAPGEFKVGYSREGWLQPWARLRNNEEDERKRLEVAPPLQVLNRVRDIKPGASVLATVQDDSGQQHPALIVQRFGRGRAAALTVGDMWRWALHDDASHRDLDKSWRQLVRWLVADVPNRVELAAEQKAADANQTVQLQIRTRDKKFQPLDDANVKVSVRYIGESAVEPPTGTNSPSASMTGQGRSSAEVPLSVEPALSEAGLYQTAYIPRDTGAYLAEVIVTDSTGVEVGYAETGWTADPAADEFRSLKPNRALLEAIAKKSGGEIVSADKLMEFVNSLERRKAPITEATSFPLWHTPVMFLLALGCFLAEWGLRRWKGLA